jgi:hypothetical protein
LVLFDVVRLFRLANLADIRIQIGYATGIFFPEYCRIKHTLVDEAIMEPVRPIEVRIRRVQGQCWLSCYCHPLVGMAMVLAPGIPLADDVQQIPPFGVKGVRRNFQTRPDMAQTRRETLAEAGAVFAEPVDTAAGEDQGGPAACIFDFLVAAPNCPI